MAVTAERVIPILVRTAVGMLMAALLIYPADWAIWSLRSALGGGTGQVVVSRFTVATLKGNKNDYYFEGRGPTDCSRSLFPQGGDSACWWLSRHPEVMVQY